MIEKYYEEKQVIKKYALKRFANVTSVTKKLKKVKDTTT